MVSESASHQLCPLLTLSPLLLCQLRWFASNQIRNVALLAANVATASPVSDMNPILVAGMCPHYHCCCSSLA